MQAFISCCGEVRKAHSFVLVRRLLCISPGRLACLMMFPQVTTGCRKLPANRCRGCLVRIQVGVWFIATATPVPTSPRSFQTPRADRSTEGARGPNVVTPALPTDESAVSVLPTQSSTMRRSISRERVPATVLTTRYAGAIEVLSHPRDAQVFLNGNVVGRAPLSIPDVAEGTI